MSQGLGWVKAVLSQNGANGCSVMYGATDCQEQDRQPLPSENETLLGHLFTLTLITLVEEALPNTVESITPFLAGVAVTQCSVLVPRASQRVCGVNE